MVLQPWTMYTEPPDIQTSFGPLLNSRRFLEFLVKQLLALGSVKSAVTFQWGWGHSHGQRSILCNPKTQITVSVSEDAKMFFSCRIVPGYFHKQQWHNWA